MVEYVLAAKPQCMGLDASNPSFFDSRSNARVVKSGVRAATREHATNIVPIVHGMFSTTKPDTWGNYYFIEVEYSKDGYRATYGGHFSNGALVWSCYMD